MTVMVTGASGLLGRAIVQVLVQRDEVRATVRRPEAGEALRLLGAKVAVRPIEEPEELIEILRYALVATAPAPTMPTRTAAAPPAS